ncbi:LOW QUALITY PROTEIN: WRKY domain-containing protein, partial [Cephalotus follicularis]
VVEDGYQWRKYGKVVRDNPSLRAYFKCYFATTCHVKKHTTVLLPIFFANRVQRSIEDPSVLVATYEGEHNHPHPTQIENMRHKLLWHFWCSLLLNLHCLQWTNNYLRLDKIQSGNNLKTSKPSVDSPEIRQFMVEQMASSLTKDPNFTAALAVAISRKMLLYNATKK